VLVEYLRCFILEDQSNWDKCLPYATFVFNTTPHTATGFTANSFIHSFIHLLVHHKSHENYIPLAVVTVKLILNNCDELLFGRKPNIPDVLQKEPPDVQYTHDNYIKELQSRLQSSYQTAKINLKSQKERSKEYHDRNINTPLFSVGDKVLLHDEKNRRGRSSKLSPSWIGPYEVTDIDNVNIILKLPRHRTLTVHANRLKPFFG
jgi:hypothetical protein